MAQKGFRDKPAHCLCYSWNLTKLLSITFFILRFVWCNYILTWWIIENTSPNPNTRLFDLEMYYIFFDEVLKTLSLKLSFLNSFWFDSSSLCNHFFFSSNSGPSSSLLCHLPHLQQMSLWLFLFLNHNMCLQFPPHSPQALLSLVGFHRWERSPRKLHRRGGSWVVQFCLHAVKRKKHFFVFYIYYIYHLWLERSFWTWLE